MPVKSFRDLEVWQVSLQLVKEVYLYTRNFPKDEIYGLVFQMRRAAISIPSNIAEGSERGTTKDYLNFVKIANGSASELETQMVIGKMLYPEHDEVTAMQLLGQVQRMLGGLIRALS